MKAWLRRMREWSRGQWVLRATVLAGVVLALLAPAVDGRRPATFLLVVGLALGLLSAALPDRHVLAAASIWVLISWARTDPHALGVSAGVGAVGLLAAHLSAGLAAYGPGRMSPDRGLLRLWTIRGVLLLVPALVVALVGSLVGDRGGEALWIAAGAVVVVLAIAGSMVARRAAAERP